MFIGLGRAPRALVNVKGRRLGPSSDEVGLPMPIDGTPRTHWSSQVSSGLRVGAVSMSPPGGDLRRLMAARMASGGTQGRGGEQGTGDGSCRERLADDRADQGRGCVSSPDRGGAERTRDQNRTGRKVARDHGSEYSNGGKRG
jgi:hypothetical protein